MSKFQPSDIKKQTVVVSYICFFKIKCKKKIPVKMSILADKHYYMTNEQMQIWN